LRDGCCDRKADELLWRCRWGKEHHPRSHPTPMRFSFVWLFLSSNKDHDPAYITCKSHSLHLHLLQIKSHTTLLISTRSHVSQVDFRARLDANRPLDTEQETTRSNQLVPESGNLEQPGPRPRGSEEISDGWDGSLSPTTLDQIGYEVYGLLKEASRGRMAASHVSNCLLSCQDLEQASDVEEVNNH